MSAPVPRIFNAHALSTLTFRAVVAASRRRESEQASVPRGSGPAVAERRLRSWGSQVELAEDFEQGMSLSHSSAAGSSAEPDEQVLSLESYDLADSALLASSKDILMEPSQPACSAYSELLKVMAHATQRLDLLWKRKTPQIARGRLDERFLAGHNRRALVSLPFLPELHAEFCHLNSKLNSTPGMFDCSLTEHQVLSPHLGRLDNLPLKVGMVG
ncbi:hypothetical protein DPX16_23864 [Anabarilius grahami]|uniref:Uncharacterized protein n=1 Tax=Anabarilius grahami TaxID=495550 RepID=A0A3N0XTP7_ANAGA|nr:hypothetical protein DPX16_23864 [Anabarilius grahami]